MSNVTKMSLMEHHSAYSYQVISISAQYTVSQTKFTLFIFVITRSIRCLVANLLSCNTTKYY